MTTQSKGDTNLSFQSDAAINSVSAGSSGIGYRDVIIAATGDITAAAANSAGISARNITLTSTAGSVGAIATPLAIAPHPDAPVNGVINNGIVNITANGDIGINATPSAGNDLRVGSIISTSGDILINVASGSIVNARGQTATGAERRPGHCDLERAASNGGYWRRSSGRRDCRRVRAEGDQ